MEYVSGQDAQGILVASGLVDQGHEQPFVGIPSGNGRLRENTKHRGAC